MIDWTALPAVVAAMIAGGLLKGATGAGAPVVAVPVLALFYDVQFAVALFVIPNFCSNAWQGWTYRAAVTDRRLALLFAASGLVGAGVGTVMLVNLPSGLLIGAVALAVLLYIGFRIARPDWTLPRETGRRLAVPAGLLGGVLQGAAGISAPASITFLNAMRLDREEFIGTISLFFMAMCLVQIPLLSAYGLLTPHVALLGLLAMIPLFGAMPVGAWMARHVSRAAFDRIVLGLLGILSLRLLAEATGLW
ncbi:sulfite exporter TauE/SafE family protein [Wenxinia marina]|uniref:Probable membrane transporter protein n=1 Tax=Wenxinia marina DSM 24838 TaxID=1123501 RepID=A0A0D0NS18_9RHOB|nr:sulfite exporter TauE/SafE family protein [Wenxinia marina]KIQ71030.1 Sulfite exporter TauE/SafE [Wenxinia marina DSM 24838]GGL55445.1 hypothetical protein GCM10011392_07260 [Wenxinia marina]